MKVLEAAASTQLKQGALGCRQDQHGDPAQVDDDPKEVTFAEFVVKDVAQLGAGVRVELTSHAQQQGSRRRFFGLDDGQWLEVVEQLHGAPPQWVERAIGWAVAKLVQMISPP